MRQMMFAKEFPKNHPRAGEPTLFPEKLWAGWADDGLLMDNIDFGIYPMYFHGYYNAAPKHHTIRAGQHWKVGDIFLPKIWSSKPYRSKTITIGPPIEVKKIWSIIMTRYGTVFIGGYSYEQVGELAKNDGLSPEDFDNWFPANQHFEGQIICWNEKIKYFD